MGDPEKAADAVLDLFKRQTGTAHAKCLRSPVFRSQVIRAIEVEMLKDHEVNLVLDSEIRRVLANHLSKVRILAKDCGPTPTINDVKTQIAQLATMVETLRELIRHQERMWQRR